MEVAACSFPESKQIRGPRGPNSARQRPGFMPCGQTCQQPLHEEPGFQACQRDTSGSNCTGVSSGGQQKDHSALVPIGRIVQRHDKTIPQQKENSAY